MVDIKQQKFAPASSILRTGTGVMAELADIREKDKVEETKQEIMKDNIFEYKKGQDPRQVSNSCLNKEKGWN